MLTNSKAKVTSENVDSNNIARTFAGLLLFLGAAQYLLAILISESVYVGYKVGQQFESDLGNWSLAGKNAAIYNISSVLLGMFLIASAYYLQRAIKYKRLPLLLAIAGISIIVTGVVSENISPIVESFFSFIAFVTVIACAIRSHKFVKSPFVYILTGLGAFSLLALILFVLGQSSSFFYLGIGKGGMEGLAVYPLVLWVLGYGAYLTGQSKFGKIYS